MYHRICTLLFKSSDAEVSHLLALDIVVETRYRKVVDQSVLGRMERTPCREHSSLDTSSSIPVIVNRFSATTDLSRPAEVVPYMVAS